jgi:hypothetical protein
MKKPALILLVAFCIINMGVANAHSGRTDCYGGHWQRTTGTYHYHNQNPCRYRIPNYYPKIRCYPQWNK